MYSHVAHFKTAYERMAALEPKLKALVANVKQLREAATKDQVCLSVLWLEPTFSARRRRRCWRNDVKRRSRRRSSRTRQVCLFLLDT